MILVKSFFVLYCKAFNKPDCNFLGFITFSHHTTEGKAYWYNVCKSPIVDALIREDCSGLVSDHDPGGYGFSEEGWHVLQCLGGGAVSLFGISRDQLESVGDSLGIHCG